MLRDLNVLATHNDECMDGETKLPFPVDSDIELATYLEMVNAFELYRQLISDPDVEVMMVEIEMVPENPMDEFLEKLRPESMN